jgi:hypothetical protein
MYTIAEQNMRWTDWVTLLRLFMLGRDQRWVSLYVDDKPSQECALYYKYYYEWNFLCKSSWSEDYLHVYCPKGELSWLKSCHISLPSKELNFSWTNRCSTAIGTFQHVGFFTFNFMSTVKNSSFCTM